MKKFLESINIIYQCKKYGVPVWQCPQFLFIIMGIVIIAAILIVYVIGSRYVDNPEVVALIVIITTLVLFIIAFIITRNFESLAKVSRMKAEFVSIVTHQLRAPITNLKWTIDFLLSKDGKNIGEKQIDYLKIIKENSYRMGELIDDLLIVSRLEKGKFAFKRQKLSLEDTVNKIIDDFQAYAEASNVKMEKDIQKNLPEINTDPLQLKIIIENLINNAIRYNAGKGKVKIKVFEKNKDIYFEIEDNGIGIPVYDQQYIFQKFFRSQNALKYQTQGSGLGLYIIKMMLKNLGGKINFKSEEGKGSNFWFFLPVS